MNMDYQESFYLCISVKICALLSSTFGNFKVEILQSHFVFALDNVIPSGVEESNLMLRNFKQLVSPPSRGRSGGGEEKRQVTLP